MISTVDRGAIRQAARGQCVAILQHLGSLTDLQLNPKVHGPCPRCGGSDRFRAFDDVNETGGLFCNQCGTRSDIFASVQWLRNCTFPQALQLVADFVGNSHTIQAANVRQKSMSEPTK